VAAPNNWIWDTAPDCIQQGVPGLPFGIEGTDAPAEAIFAPFQGCTDVGGGFFTFGPGRQWFGGGYVYLTPEGGSTGDVLYGGASGLYVLTVIGVAVMILAFIAFVWTEHRKLMDRANKLRAAMQPPSPPAGGPETE